MDKDEIAAKVIEIINGSIFEPKEIGLDDHLEDDVGLDSIGYITLTEGIEKHFAVDIPDEVVENFKTVREAVEAIMTAPAIEVDE